MRKSISISVFLAGLFAVIPGHAASATYQGHGSGSEIRSTELRGTGRAIGLRDSLQNQPDARVVVSRGHPIVATDFGIHFSTGDVGVFLGSDSHRFGHHRFKPHHFKPHHFRHRFKPHHFRHHSRPHHFRHRFEPHHFGHRDLRPHFRHRDLRPHFRHRQFRPHPSFRPHPFRHHR